MPEAVNHPLLSEWMLLGKTSYQNFVFLGAIYLLCLLIASDIISFVVV